jgi:hypothetical protein
VIWSPTLAVLAVIGIAVFVVAVTLPGPRD